MTCLTGVLQWLFRNSSEGSGKEKELIGWLCTLRSVSAVSSSRNSDGKFECSWVRVRGKDNKPDILVRVFYRPLNHDEAFYRWL